MTSILCLNQDCLNNIFKYFTIYELIDIEETCSAFKATCEEIYSTKKFHSYRIELRYLRAEYLDAIFERIGDTLRSFEFSGGGIMDEGIKQTVIDAVSNNCMKLNKLSLNYLHFDNNQFRELQKCFTNLTYLDLSRCNISESRIDCLDGEKFKNIKTLKLAGNVQMSGAFFKSMKHVEKLNATYCYELRYFEFQQFLKNCINLIELDVSASCQVIPEDQDILEQILQYQPNIERLIMNDVGIERNKEILSKFKHLKHSSITGRKFGT
ncbi:hypothetical protein ACKWTF_007178 [Chironomus riparius]